MCGLDFGIGVGAPLKFQPMSLVLAMRWVRVNHILDK